MAQPPEDNETVAETAAREGAEALTLMKWARGRGDGPSGPGPEGVREPVAPRPPITPTTTRLPEPDQE